MNSIWAPVVASIVGGAFGVAGGIGGSWIGHVAARRREEDSDRRKLRDQRDERLRQTYLDMAQHLQNRRGWLEVFTETRVEFSDRSETHLSFSSPLTPRVWLYCDRPIADAWNRYEENTAALKDEDFDGELRGLPGSLSLTRAKVEAVASSIDEVWGMVRAAAEALELA